MKNNKKELSDKALNKVSGGTGTAKGRKPNNEEIKFLMLHFTSYYFLKHIRAQQEDIDAVDKEIQDFLKAHSDLDMDIVETYRTIAKELYFPK